MDGLLILLIIFTLVLAAAALLIMTCAEVVLQILDWREQHVRTEEDEESWPER